MYESLTKLGILLELDTNRQDVGHKVDGKSITCAPS